VGKTILLRAIAGIWPFGRGRINVPGRARMLFVPQWPYLPRGSLRAAVSYPAPEGAFPDARIREALGLLGLAHLATRLDDTAPWDEELSPHEQQRLALARVLLDEPEWVFLDKATWRSTTMEKRVYALLTEPAARDGHHGRAPAGGGGVSHPALDDRAEPAGSASLQAA
jgi:putative ATP-binding cassette transporter